MSIDRLQEQIRKLKTPIMVGLEPTLPSLPPHLVRNAVEEHGQTLKAAAAACYTFCTQVLDRLNGLVPGVSLRSACFASLGAEGVAQLQRVSQYAQELGYYVLMDSMAGLADSPAESYAQAMFGKITLGEEACQVYHCDGLTLNPLLGSDSVKPFLPYCKKEGKNIFLLLKSPNKSSREVQDLLSGDRVVYTAMADLARRWGEDMIGRYGYSQVGGVAGATFPQALKLLREKYDRLFLVVTGCDEQGGKVKNASYAFDRFGHGAVVCASRSILCAWQKNGTDGRDYLEQAEKAVLKMKAELGKYVVIL